MKNGPIIISPKLPRLTLTDFCGLHNLIIRVNERDDETRRWGSIYNKIALNRFWAEIPNLEICKGEEWNNFTCFSPCGNGNSISAAIKDLAKQMNGNMLRINGHLVKAPEKFIL